MRGRDAIDRAVGRRIQSVRMDAEGNGGNGCLDLSFEDGSTLSIFDSAQYCCEHRYLTTDDDLTAFEGAVFVDAEVRDVEGPDEDEFGESHDVAFLVVTTDKGSFTVCTHNEHNGYYGGFDCAAVLL